MRKILLHACCAPCASFPIKKLILDGFEPIVYFYNPNIFPFEEYEIRRKELKSYCLKNKVVYYEGNYEEDLYYSLIEGLEEEPEKGKRCEKCFYLRLFKSAEFAKSINTDCFTTSLTVSPHKNSDQIFKAGNLISKLTGVEFICYNFKKQDGFKISRQIAKDNNMYFQTYCGCEYSIRK